MVAAEFSQRDLVIGACSPFMCADDPPVIPLWEKGAPGFEDKKDEKEVRDRENKDTGEYRTTDVHNPYVTVFLPPKEKATGAAVVIVPGGGHRELWVKHEGENVAAWLAEKGVAGGRAAVPPAREKGSPYKIDVHALQDGQRARAARAQQGEGVEHRPEPRRHDGLLRRRRGGGDGVPQGREGERRTPPTRSTARARCRASRRWCTPVRWAFGGRRSRRRTPRRRGSWSATTTARRTGWCSTTRTLKKAGVSAELHVYAKTPHAFGFRPYKATGKPVDSWPQRFLEFLDAQGMLKKP